MGGNNNKQLRSHTLAEDNFSKYALQVLSVIEDEFYSPLLETETKLSALLPVLTNCAATTVAE